MPPPKEQEIQVPKPLLAGLAMLVLLGLIAPFASIPSGVDAGYHLLWIREFISLAASGTWFPRWIPDAYHGFGSAAFYLYPPLTYYIALGFHALTGSSNPNLLFQLTAFAGTLISFVAAQALLRGLGATRLRSRIGATIYTFAPYRIAELYSRSSLSSHIGYAFFPLVWLGLIAMCSSDSHRRVLGSLLFAVSSALVLLSNVALAIITALSAVVIAFVIPRRMLRAVVVPTILGTLLALGVSAFYLSSVAVYSSDVHLSHLIDAREYFWQDLLHFRDLPGLFHLGLLYASVFFLFYTVWRARKNGAPMKIVERIAFRCGITMSLVIGVLELPLIGSFFLAQFPLLQMIQGTWRLYIDTVLFMALAAGVVRSEALQRPILGILSIWSACSIALLILVVFHLHLFSHSSPASTDPYTYAPRYTITNTSSLDSILHDHASDARTVFLPFGLSDRINLLAQNGTSEVYEVHLQQSTPVIFHRFYWPAWHLYANGLEIENRPDSLGRAIVNMPSGTYEAIWKLESTTFERTALVISEISFAVIFAVSGIELFHSRRKVKEDID